MIYYSCYLCSIPTLGYSLILFFYGVGMKLRYLKTISVEYVPTSMINSNAIWNHQVFQHIIQKGECKYSVYNSMMKSLAVG